MCVSILSLITVSLYSSPHCFPVLTHMSAKSTIATKEYGYTQFNDEILSVEPILLFLRRMSLASFLLGNAARALGRHVVVRVYPRVGDKLGTSTGNVQ